MKTYQVCVECQERFPPTKSLGYADNKCPKCSGPEPHWDINIHADPIVTSVDLLKTSCRSRSVTQKKPEREAEAPPSGQEDEHRLERHPYPAGFPGPTESVEITEEGLEALKEQQEEIPPEAHVAGAP